MPSLWEELHALQPMLSGLFDGVIAQDGTPDLLCHYTDFSGLKGILETKQLWATYSRVLNDSTEQKYGESLILDRAAKNVSVVFQSSLRSGLSAERRNFVACFCESSDVLSMWQTYARSGGGYCLEFSGADLLSCTYPPHPTVLNLKMIYDPEVKGALGDLIDELCKVPDSLGSAVVIGSWMSLLAMKLKHPAFRAEREWRIVVQEPVIELLDFRSGYSDIKPYIKLSPTLRDGHKRLPLKRIVFGPTLRQDSELIESIGLMLKKNGLSGIPVEPSGIPYRL